MPYNRINELPEDMRDHLPKEAQLVYKEAYNKAWSHYDDLEEWCLDSDFDLPVEELAHHKAWKTVNRIFQKQDRKWIRKRGF